VGIEPIALPPRVSPALDSHHLSFCLNTEANESTNDELCHPLLNGLKAKRANGAADQAAAAERVARALAFATTAAADAERFEPRDPLFMTSVTTFERHMDGVGGYPTPEHMWRKSDYRSTNCEAKEVVFASKHVVWDADGTVVIFDTAAGPELLGRYHVGQQYRIAPIARCPPCGSVTKKI
jgi:hypothetical protein